MLRVPHASKAQHFIVRRNIVSQIKRKIAAKITDSVGPFAAASLFKRPAAANEQPLQEHVDQLAQLAQQVRSRPAAAMLAEEQLRASGRLTLFADALSLGTAFIFGGLIAWAINVYLLADGFQALLNVTSIKQFMLFIALGGSALLWLDQQGHYRLRMPFWESAGHVLTVALTGLLVGGFIQFAAKHDFSRLWLGLSWTLFAGLLLFGRAGVRRWLQARGKWQVPVLLLGHGPTARAIKLALEDDLAMGYHVVAQVDVHSVSAFTQPRQWQNMLAETGANHVLLALEGDEMHRVAPALKALVRGRVSFSLAPSWGGMPVAGLTPHHFFTHDAVLLHNTNRLTLLLPRLLKRSFDTVLSSLALAALAPLLLVVAVLIRRDGGSVLFIQPRVGQHGRLFGCYKFRSMIANAESVLLQHLEQNPAAAEEWRAYQKLRDDPRITAVGHFIRKTSIDELPQLLNVLKGDMSLIGPRPMMDGQQPLYGDDIVYYTAVKPGLSGPWQVSGRNSLSFEERVRLEAWYSRNWSLWMDIVILLKTPRALFDSTKTS